MLETDTKNWEKAAFEKGVEKYQIEIVERMAENGMSNADIRKITGLSLNKIGYYSGGIQKSGVRSQESELEKKVKKMFRKSLLHDKNALFHGLFLLNSEYCILTPE